MYFEHAPAIWNAFPALVPGILLVEGIHPHADVAPRLAPLFARARARLAGASEADLPEVQAWRRAFSQMGLKPTQYRSAAEALPLEEIGYTRFRFALRWTALAYDRRGDRDRP